MDFWLFAGNVIKLVFNYFGGVGVYWQFRHLSVMGWWLLQTGALHFLTCLKCWFKKKKCYDPNLAPGSTLGTDQNSASDDVFILFSCKNINVRFSNQSFNNNSNLLSRSLWFTKEVKQRFHRHCWVSSLNNNEQFTGGRQHGLDGNVAHSDGAFWGNMTVAMFSNAWNCIDDADLPPARSDDIAVSIGEIHPKWHTQRSVL